MARIKEVGAITVIQPWAHCIVHEGKNVENRSRNSRYRGILAIHASSTRSRADFEDCPIRLERDEVEYGMILGFARLVDVITKKDVTRQTRKWFRGKFGLVLEDVVPLRKPVPTMGARGLWKLRGRALGAALRQLSSRNKRRLGIPLN